MTVAASYFSNKKTALIADPAQQLIVQELQIVHDNLIHEIGKRQQFPFIRKPKCVSGIYLWGGVGIGKTYLMDCFFESLPFKQKMRIHFFEFMQMVHRSLKENNGKTNPLDHIVKKLGRDYRIICLDEFIVTDIVDAMLLTNFLKAVFREGITLVMTSNTAPDDLYHRGLQREQFLPAIELLKRYTRILHLASTNDYRLHAISGQEGNTHDESCSHKILHEIFKSYAQGKKSSIDQVEIAGRNIKLIARANNIIWFDFKNICHIPRSTTDYLAISKHYSTIIVSNIPAIGPHEKNLIRLFISMVDVFYDANIHFIFSTKVPIEKIYVHGDMIAEFKRTKSRLIAMQNQFNQLQKVSHV